MNDGDSFAASMAYFLTRKGKGKPMKKTKKKSKTIVSKLNREKLETKVDAMVSRTQECVGRAGEHAKAGNLQFLKAALRILQTVETSAYEAVAELEDG